MKKWIIILIGIVAAFIAFKIYKKNLQEQVMKGYNIDFDAVKNKTISDLREALKALNKNKS